MTINISEEQAEDIREWARNQLEYESLEIEYAQRLTDLLQEIAQANQRISNVGMTPTLLKQISDKLDSLEKETYYSTGVKMYSGGFANAELYNYDDEYADIELKWGIQNDVENVVHTEHYKLNLQTIEWE